MEILEQLVETLVDLGRSFGHYSGAVADYIAGLVGEAFVNMGVAWYVIVIAILLLGVLYWINRL
jgi:hypothetical protein